MMGGTMRAPLTATLFAVELTGDQHALLPLLIACAIAYATTALLLKRSILTEKIARRGLHITREYQADPFDQAWVKDVMVMVPDTISSAWTVGRSIDYFMSAEHRHKSYPVITADRTVIAMVSRGDVLTWIMGSDGPDREATLEEILDQGLLFGRPDELVGNLADRMAEQGVGRVPIVDAAGRLVGLVARKDLLAARARRVAEERDRARLLGRRIAHSRVRSGVPSGFGACASRVSRGGGFRSAGAVVIGAATGFFLGSTFSVNPVPSGGFRSSAAFWENSSLGSGRSCTMSLRAPSS